MTQEKAPPMAHPRVAAGALFCDDAERVLLVKPTYKEGWDLPGGYVEPGETPTEGCERARDQRGAWPRASCRPSAGRGLGTLPNEGDKVLFIFEGGAIETETYLQLPEAELSDVRYFSTEQLASALNERLTRRVTAAMDAKAGHKTRYLEHGLPLTAGE